MAGPDAPDFGNVCLTPTNQTTAKHFPQQCPERAHTCVKFKRGFQGSAVAFKRRLCCFFLMYQRWSVLLQKQFYALPFKAQPNARADVFTDYSLGKGLRKAVNLAV